MKRVIILKLIFIIIFFSFFMIACSKKEKEQDRQVNSASTFSGTRLRSSYMILSLDDVKSMLSRKGFFDRKWNPSGSFNNNYQSRTINGDKVVIDRATGLIWDQSGSYESIIYEKVEQWIRDLNNRGYAGYNDWRLPTLEEGASLLENSKQNGNLYIDPVFSDRQSRIWTGDKYGFAAAWVVYFVDGYVHYFNLYYGLYYVRPVRPWQSTVSSQVTKPSVQPSIFTGTGPQLRPSYMTLSLDDVESMLSQKGFFHKYWNKSGSFNNNYQSITINGDKVVIDKATGLMWHQSGSSKSMRYEGAEQWIKYLNNKGYAGYNDWRLPTLEEGASLLENSKQNGNLYIDPVFSDRQSRIWTGDKYGFAAAWVVYFVDGYVHYFNLYYGLYYVRPVRPWQSTVSSQVTKPSVQPSIFTGTGPQLRSSYMTLSLDDVKSMLSRKGFFDKNWNKSGSFNNNYQSRTINGDKVVIDRATGLMWHQSGSSEYMTYEKAEQWIRDLNNRGYAGYNDWRLPTLEEGASLLENSKQNGDLYIDSVFSDRQSWIWTGDKYGSDAAWVVGFSLGCVYNYFSLGYYGRFVRPVRPGQ